MRRRPRSEATRTSYLQHLVVFALLDIVQKLYEFGNMDNKYNVFFLSPGIG